jgi:hypothetical protein
MWKAECQYLRLAAILIAAECQLTGLAFSKKICTFAPDLIFARLSCSCSIKAAILIDAKYFQTQVLLNMSIEEIEKFLDNKTIPQQSYVKIDFKKRDSIYGLFLQGNDYKDLKSKNFWRIVTKAHFDEYKKSKNAGLAKIFSGSDFSRLTVQKES